MRPIDVATVVRSTNAGPYELTLDVVLADPEAYERAVRAVTRERIAELYAVPEVVVLELGPPAPAHALKITVRRPLAAGALGGADVYGEQHAPLPELEL